MFADDSRWNSSWAPAAGTAVFPQYTLCCVLGVLTDIFYMISVRPLVWFKEPTDGGWIKILEVYLSVGEAFDLANKNVRYGKPENIL